MSSDHALVRRGQDRVELLKLYPLPEAEIVAGPNKSGNPHRACSAGKVGPDIDVAAVARDRRADKQPVSAPRLRRPLEGAEYRVATTGYVPGDCVSQL